VSSLVKGLFPEVDSDKDIRHRLIQLMNKEGLS
jgi:hypothetical protein